MTHQPPAAGAPGPRLLLAEDDKLVRNTLVDVVSEDFPTIFEAADGQEALELAAREHPDLVLLDVMMPRMNGFEACRAIRQLAGMEHVPIVILTALRTEDEAAQAFNAGATDYLTKPFAVGQLRARLRTALLGTPTGQEP